MSAQLLVAGKNTISDRHDFDNYVSRFHRQAYSIAYRLAGNHTDAEDITQEAFLRAYRFFDRYNRSMPFENWLYRIISNVFIDELRKRPKIQSHSLDQPIGGSHGESEIKLEIPDEHANPQVRLLESSLEEPLQLALNALPAEFRRTVLFADVEGLSYDEIAETMGCSLGTVRSRLHRGRKILRNRLQGKLGRTA